MKINLEWLQEKSACKEGVEWFKQICSEQEQTEGKDYQSLLDELARENKIGWAQWLISKAGSTNQVLEIPGDLLLDHSIFFSGFLKVVGEIVSKFIVAGSAIEAGKGIKAEEAIEAGLGIKAGEGIKAGKGIKAGDGIKAGWAIEAGLGIKAGEGIKAGKGIKAGDGIEAGWAIEAGLGIKAGKGIKAGDGIKAEDGIEAGWAIEAGLGIKAGKGIKAGEDYGIYAGISVRLSLKTKHAIVLSETKPENIVLGEWRENGMARVNKLKIAIKMLVARIEDAHLSLEKAVSNKDYNTAHIQEIRMNALLEALGIVKACIEEGEKTS